MCSADSRSIVSLLDYGAGNVRSIRNAIISLGYEIRDIKEPGDLLADDTKALLFPGLCFLIGDTWCYRYWWYLVLFLVVAL